MSQPPARPALERICALLAIVGSVWFAFTAWWGIGAIPAGGHIGAGASGTTMMAENSLRWHSIYPLWDWFALKSPYPQSADCHHPFGMYWASEIFLALFGHRDFVVNLPSVLMSTATPPLLYKLGKHCWGPVGGAAAVLGFVLLPITVGFSIFHNIEVMTMFGLVVFFLGSVRYQSWGRRRDLAMLIAGALVATSGEWVAYLVLAPTLTWSFLRAFVFPSWMTPAIRTIRYHRWWALSVGAAVGTLILWLGLFAHVDLLADWVASAGSRAGGTGIPLHDVLEARRAWIDFSFTPVAIAIGKLAAVVAGLRLVWLRKDEETFSLAALFGATMHYVGFKRGADVHIFWPHYYALFYALAFAQLAKTMEDGGAVLAARIAPAFRRHAGAVALAAVVIVSLVVGPDTVRSLKIWRETGGRYDDMGKLIDSHVDMLVVLRKVVAGHLRRGERMSASAGARVGWEHAWILRTDTDAVEQPSDRYPFWVARASTLGADQLKKISLSHKLAIYGDTVVWTRGSAPGPVDAYSLGEREPNFLEWMFVNNTEPVREIGASPDPFSTWEWRVHLDEPADAPTRAPQTLDELRIAHNVEVMNGDADGAERLREQIAGQLVRDPEAHFDGGHELMGIRVTKGVQPRLEVWFVAGGPTPNDTTFHVRSSVVRRAKLSTIPASPTDREMAWPPPLSTKLWKKGFIYKFVCVLNHRIGVERYVGTWDGPARRGSNAPIDLVELP